MMGRGWWIVWAVFFLGCDGCQGSKQAPTPKTEVRVTRPAVVWGRIRLASGAELPLYRKVDLEREVLRSGTANMAAERGHCSPMSKEDRMPVTLSPDGHLTGVLVSASEFSDAKPRPPLTHDVVIEDCRLRPRLLVAMEGDVMRVRNRVNFPLMPMFGSDKLARTLMPGQEFTYDLRQGGTVDAVLCSVLAPCGRTDVVVLHHPLYDVTDHEGRFRIENFPTDEDVTLNVWHPLFERAELKVRLGIGQERELEIELAPAAPLAVPVPAVVADEPAIAGPASSQLAGQGQGSVAP